MATTTIQFDCPTGLTLTGKLYAENGDTIQNGSGDSATERTNNLGRYTIAVTESLTGIHELGVVDGSGNLIALYITESLVDDTGTYEAYDRTATASAAAIADAVFDEAMSGHTSAGTFGLFINDAYDLQITGITTGVETRAGKHSVAGTVMMSTNAALASGVLTAKKPSDDTTFQTYTVATSSSAENITEIS